MTALHWCTLGLVFQALAILVMDAYHRRENRRLAAEIDRLERFIDGVAEQYAGLLTRYAALALQIERDPK